MTIEDEENRPLLSPTVDCSTLQEEQLAQAIKKGKQESWLWKSDSYCWSLTTLILLLLTFTALLYLVFEYNLPEMNPQVMI
jgi:hypothetical protein